MKQRKQLHRIFVAAAAALAGLTLAATSTLAQYQVGQQGRALDANNRVGGGGFNTPVWQQPNVTFGNFNNNLITGNITGGSQFRGNVPYSAPDVLRIPTAGGISDAFIRQSSGAPYGGVAQNNAQVARSYIGVSQAAAPPPGYVMQGPNGGYVPAQFKTVAPSDLRLDAAMTGSAPMASLPRPGQLLMPGPVDSNTQTSTVITASPLYGVRAWNPSAASDQAFLNNNVGGSQSALNKIDPVTLERMRNELAEPDTTDPAQLQQQMLDQQKVNKQSGMLDTAVPTPFESPQSQALSGSSPIKSNQPLGSSLITSNDTLRTGAGTQMRLMSPQQQSTQYAELQKRLQQNRTAQAMAAADAQNDAARAKANAATPTTPGGTRGAQTPGALPPVSPTGTRANAGLPVLPPSVIPNSGTPAPMPTPGASGGSGTTLIPPPANLPPVGGAITQNPAPLPIQSLAQGVKAKGLADLLTEAETQMKAGKYNSALEEYDLAEQLAPNNPLISLGRANAELGQSYYGRAELHLRQAFMQDQALLMGRIDLRSWLGNDRLTSLVQDLRGIADREQKEPRPVFLLAYICYSIGDERMAAAYLDLADKRSGGKDELYPLIRKHWELPQPAPADQNK